MADVRAARETQTRDAELRPQNWAPPQTLPMPAERAGYVHGWIRTSTLGQMDPTNVSSRFREGWIPCKASDYPEITALTDPGSRFPDNIEIGGLLLCKLPEEIDRQRREYYTQQGKAAEASVDQSYMKLNDTRMPFFAERSTTVSRGRFK